MNNELKTIEHLRCAHDSFRTVEVRCSEPGALPFVGKITRFVDDHKSDSFEVTDRWVHVYGRYVDLYAAKSPPRKERPFKYQLDRRRPVLCNKTTKIYVI